MPGESVKVSLVVLDSVMDLPPFQEDFLEDVLGILVGVDDSSDEPVEGLLVLADDGFRVWLGGHEACLWSIERGSAG